MLMLNLLSVAVVEESNCVAAVAVADAAAAAVERKHARYGYGWRGRRADPCDCPTMSMCGTDVMAAPAIPTRARSRAETPSFWRRQWPTQRSIGRLLVVAIAVTTSDLEVPAWGHVQVQAILIIQVISYPIVVVPNWE